MSSLLPTPLLAVLGSWEAMGRSWVSPLMPAPVQTRNWHPGVMPPESQPGFQNSAHRTFCSDGNVLDLRGPVRRLPATCVVTEHLKWGSALEELTLLFYLMRVDCEQPRVQRL